VHVVMTVQEAAKGAVFDAWRGREKLSMTDCNCDLAFHCLGGWLRPIPLKVYIYDVQSEFFVFYFASGTLPLNADCTGVFQHTCLQQFWTTHTSQ